MRGVPYLGDGPSEGAAVGSMILATAAPASGDYLSLAAAGQYLATNYPELAKNADFPALGEFAESAAGAAGAISNYGAALIGSEIYFLTSAGEVWKIPTAGGARVKVANAPAGLHGGNFGVGNGGFWFAGGRYWRWVYYDDGAGSAWYSLYWSTDAAAWTNANLAHYNSRPPGVVYFAGVWVTLRLYSGDSYVLPYYSNAAGTLWSQGTGTGLATKSWNFAFEWNGALYLWSTTTGALARSTDGKAWTVTTYATTNWPDWTNDAPPATFHAASGKFYGTKANTIVSAPDPAGPWTLEATVADTSASYFGVINAGRVLLAMGSTIWTTTGLASLRWSLGDGVWRVAYTGRQNDQQALWPVSAKAVGSMILAQIAVEVGGKIALFAGEHTRRISNLVDTFDLRAAPQMFGKTLYVKAK